MGSGVTGRVRFYPLYLTRFVGSLGYITLLTLLPTYIEHLGATGVVGLFVTALGVGRTVAVVPPGWAADRYDKRAILLGSLFPSAVAYALFTVVETPNGFVLARTLQGLGLVGTGMVSLALVGDIAGQYERANQIGKYNSWRMAAGIIGTHDAEGIGGRSLRASPFESDVDFRPTIRTRRPDESVRSEIDRFRPCGKWRPNPEVAPRAFDFRLV